MCAEDTAQTMDRLQQDDQQPGEDHQSLKRHVPDGDEYGVESYVPSAVAAEPSAVAAIEPSAVAAVGAYAPSAVAVNVEAPSAYAATAAAAALPVAVQYAPAPYPA